MTYEEALDYIHGLYRFGSRLGLARSRRLLAVLGDPHRGLRVIHVAGTNGKGSVAAMTASILTTAGYRTGLYVSPYLAQFGERIGIDGRPIDPEETAELVGRFARPAAEKLTASGGPGAQVTEFEFVTALGFLYYARHEVDFLVCEVGLGGRFDATNVVDRPLVAVITPIGLDHTDRLGATIECIAAEKAGIIKRSTPVVSSPQTPVALTVLAATAARRSCPLYLASSDASPGGGYGLPVRRGGRVRFKGATLAGQAVSFAGPGFPEERDLYLPLLGPHQLDNAATALTTIGVLKERGLAPAVDSRAVRDGLARTIWPGRFEVFGDHPVVVIDGAHNPPGARALAATLRQVAPGRRILLVLGLLGDKDVDAFLTIMLPPGLPEVGLVLACQPSSPRALPAADLAGRVAAASPGLRVMPVAGVAEALRLALAEAAPADIVCVAGSLYQVAEARAAAKELVGAGETAAAPSPNPEDKKGHPALELNPPARGSP